MKKKDYIKRWKDSDFLSKNEARINQVFVAGEPVVEQDLMGIITGIKSPIGLYHLGLYKKSIVRTNLSFSKFETSFVQSIITSCNFTDCVFEGADFLETQVENSKFKGVMFDDGEFKNCSFVESKIQKLRSQTSSAIRSIFIKCDFSSCVFKDVELRATKFYDCNFEGAKFVGCDLRGTKFIDGEPDPDQFVNCIQST